MDLKRLACTGVFMTAIPLFANGCGADDLCCTEFEVGADLSGVDFGVDASIAGQYTVFAQASADLAAAASGALNDVTLACENIARDLGATDDKIDAENAKGEADRVKGMCALASAQIKAGLTISGGAEAKLTINFQPPKCEASIDAKANCQAKCSGSAECDIKANPPTCEGGTLSVSCSGSCSASAEAPSFECKGSCDVAASGKCTAQGGVECQGKCEGTCKGAAEGGTGTGVKADGTCDGTCEGSCEAVKPDVKCNGSFEGQCKGSCTATPGSAKVECSGKCSAEAEPLKCSGGELKGGCKVEAKCDANCDASVSAKAECQPPSLDIRLEGNANLDVNAQAKVGAVINTLKVNLPNILVVFKARGQAIVKLAGNVAGSADAVFSPGDLSVKGAACLIPIIGAIKGAAETLPATLEASASVSASAGIK